MTKQKLGLLFMILTLGLWLTACNQEDREQAEEDVQIEPPMEEEQTEEEPEIPKFVFPLTGIPTDSEPTNRAIAVTINNHPLARPQSGLINADIIYEMLVEGSITRLLAIFQSEYPERVGPVRSAREYFIDVAQGYDSVYVAHGYSPKAKEMLNAGVIDHINGMRYDGTLFKRSSDRKAPHNSYTFKDSLLEGMEKLKYEKYKVPQPLSFFPENELGNISGQDVTEITVSYSKNKDFIANYEYKPNEKSYARIVNGNETVDKETDEPIRLANIFVIETAHQVVDSSGRRNIDLTSGGKGLVFHQGKMVEVEWKNESARILPYKDGAPYSFVPGKTWIHVVPDLNIVSFQ